MKIFLKIIAGFAVVFLLVSGGFYAYLSVEYPKVSPAEKIKIETNNQRLIRGKYLVENVCDCFGCHSNHDYLSFGFPVKKGTKGQGGFLFDHKLLGLPGDIYSRNITSYGLKKWTDGEIVRALRVGVNKDGKALFNFMPYQQFTLLCQEDIYSIISYLRSVKAIAYDPPPTKLDFPVNLIIQTVPKDAPPFPPAPGKKNLLEYGRYMTNAALCAACHTPVDDHGVPLPGMEFAGGMEFHFPGGGTIRSLNITPDNTGIGEWTKNYFIKRFRLGQKLVNTKTPVKPNEFNTPMPWESYGNMTDEDLGAIYEYLHNGVKPVKHQVEKFTPSDTPTASAK
ncbi:MAG TPA: c-type cytochrome [bacterium]